MLTLTSDALPFSYRAMILHVQEDRDRVVPLGRIVDVLAHTQAPSPVQGPSPIQKLVSPSQDAPIPTARGK